MKIWYIDSFVEFHLVVEQSKKNIYVNDVAVKWNE